jgi:hypothetical protein
VSGIQTNAVSFIQIADVEGRVSDLKISPFLPNFEESMNAPDPDPPCTPPKSTGNGGAGQVDPDGQMESEDDDSDDLQVAKPKRKWNNKMEWTLIKRWVIGEK